MPATDTNAQLDPTSPDWHSHIRAAERIDDPDGVAWDGEADFVIVGYGGGGVAAAVEAAQKGLSVIAIDRYEGGGSTAMNGGIYYAGGGTKIQKEAGVDDSPEEMFKYLQMETQGVVSDETLWRFCETSPATLDWLMDQGVQFNSTYYPRKTSYPWIDYYLFHPDSTMVPAYAKVAKPAARGHRGYLNLGPVAQGFGITLFNPLRDKARELGVELLQAAQAQNLILDASGKVIGVRIKQLPPDHPQAENHRKFTRLATKYQLMIPTAMPGSFVTIGIGRYYAQKVAKIEAAGAVERRIRAHHAVLLSCGGFVQNKPMLEHHAPKYASGMPNGSPGDDGSGIRLGQTAGGAVDRMSHVSAWRFMNPPHAWIQGILVNKRGDRYVTETLYGASLGYALVEEQEGVSYLIINRTLAKRAWHQLRHERMLSFQRDPAILAMLFTKKKGASIEALARKLSMEPSRLKASITAYNEAAIAGREDPFGKAREDIEVMTEGPYYAIDMSITSRLFPLPIITMGGLKVDEASGQVLRPDGSTVEGLYAAGRTAIGVCSNIYVSGLSAADCIFSGRRAADHIAGRAHNQRGDTSFGVQPLASVQ